MSVRAHPAVRRATIWWTMQAMGWVGLTLTLVLLAFWKPSSQMTIAAVVSLVLGPLFVFFAIKQIKGFRHEYRYSDDDLEQVEE